MTTKTLPPCKDARRWVQERLKDKRCFAPFTGQDSRAFSAFVHLLELYVVSGYQPRVIKAMRATVLCVQPSVRHLFKAAIPWALDWGDEERLWTSIVCSREPRDETPSDETGP